MWTGAFTPRVPSKTRALCLVRHAKSDYPPGVLDFERPLAKRGRRDALAIGRWLGENFEPRARVLVSSATRTQQTWQLVMREFHHTGEVQFERAIYEASVDDLLEVLRSQDDDELNLVMVGHSPGLEGLALLLSANQGDSQLREQILVKFPTSAIVRLRTDEPWSQAGSGKFELSDFYVARGVSPST